jgi:hypothetical protein
MARGCACVLPPVGSIVLIIGDPLPEFGDMGINVKRVSQTAEAKRNAPKPLPRIKGRLTQVVKMEAPAPAPIAAVLAPAVSSKKDLLLKELWDEMGVIKKERAIMSSRTHEIVTAVHARILRDEGPVNARDFMGGKLPDKAIRDQYAEIQAYTDSLMQLYDKIKHVEKFGDLPAAAEPVSGSESNDVSALRWELTRLKDLICKTKRKIAVGKAKNPSRIPQWEEKLALAEAQRDDVRAKIKKLQYDARDN